MTGAVRVVGGTVLRFAPHAKFRLDAVRQAWVVLLPERLMLPDEQATAVLRLVDGARAADAVIDALSQEYEAPRAIVAADVLPMLQDLVDKKVLVADNPARDNVPSDSRMPGR